MMEPIGKLYLKIIKAKNTLALDFGGTSDPFVLASVICNIQTGFSSNNQIFKTAVISKTLNPVWKNEEFVFDVTQPSQDLYIEMWDEDKLTANDFMGLVKVSLPDLASSSNSIKMGDMMIPMKGKKNKASKKNRGEIHLNYQFFSVEDLTSVLVKDRIIIKSIAKIIHNDEFAKPLMFILANHGDLIESIKEVITTEVESTENPNVLFRNDSLATKLTVSTFRIIGRNYLEAVIIPLVMNIINQNQSLEVDPDKSGLTLNQCENNLKSLLIHCELFLDTIINSIPLVPEEMRILLQHIFKEVEKKFPQEKNSGIKSVGGFFFLRFVNAAIFSPENLNFVKETPSVDSKRSLILISKILQNTSNLVIFSKEPYLQQSNPFIQSKFGPISNFFSELSTIKQSNYSAEKLRPLFQTDQVTLLKYSDVVFNSIQEKRQQVQFKIKTLISDSHKILDDLEIRCNLSSILLNQESKKHHLK